MKDSKIIIYSFKFINELPHDFIEDIWGTDTNLGFHFRAKFNGFCNTEGYASANAILKFFYALTENHQELLCDYILKWIENKQSKS